MLQYLNWNPAVTAFVNRSGHLSPLGVSASNMPGAN